jgi:hypothetical protein
MPQIGTFTINSNDPYESTRTVSLQGRGLKGKERKEDDEKLRFEGPLPQALMPDSSAESIEDSGNSKAEGHAFITPAERPSVGEEALKEPGEEKPRARRPRKPPRRAAKGPC